MSDTEIEADGSASDEEADAAIGRRLDAVLMARSLTISDLARWAGVSRETVHQALKGKASLLTVARLAAALHVTDLTEIIPDLEAEAKRRYPKSWRRRLRELQAFSLIPRDGSAELGFGVTPRGQDLVRHIREDSRGLSYGTEAGRELEGFAGEMDRLVRTLSSAEAGELPVEAKIAILNGFEEAARVAGRRLPAEYWDVRRRLVEQVTESGEGRGSDAPGSGR